MVSDRAVLLPGACVGLECSAKLLIEAAEGLLQSVVSKVRAAWRLALQIDRQRSRRLRVQGLLLLHREMGIVAWRQSRSLRIGLRCRHASGMQTPAAHLISTGLLTP